MRPPTLRGGPAVPDPDIEFLDLDLGEFDPVNNPGDHTFLRLVFERKNLPPNYRLWDLEGVKDFLTDCASKNTLPKGVQYANMAKDFCWGPEGPVSTVVVAVDDRRSI